jgi:hypothetical protein
MVPLDTHAYVTCWLPLRSLSEQDSALIFASGSHRDFSLPYWRAELGDLTGRYPVESYPLLALGDATWHAGWTLHSSPPQPKTGPPRAAMAVSFFADGARRLPPARLLQRQPHSEDAAGSAAWLRDVPEGAVARHPLLPIVFGNTPGG